MKYKFDFFKIYLIMSIASSLVIFSYEMISRLISGHKWNMFFGFFSVLVYSLIFNALFIEYVRRVHSLEIRKDKVLWKNFWGVLREFETKDIDEVSVRNFLKYFRYIEVRFDNTEVRIPLLFKNNDEIIFKIKAQE